MRNLKPFIVVLFAILFIAPACSSSDYDSETPEGYAYVLKRDVVAKISPVFLYDYPDAPKEHTFKAGEWVCSSALYPDSLPKRYNKCYYYIPKGTYRLLYKNEIENLKKRDSAFAREAKTWKFLSESGSKIGGAERTIPMEHLFWLVIPGLLICLVGKWAKSIMNDEKRTDDEVYVFRWLPIALLSLYIIEIGLAALLLYLGALNGEMSYMAGILFAIPGLILMAMNGYGAFAMNSALLTQYGVNFPLKRVIIYTIVSLLIFYFSGKFIPSVMDNPIMLLPKMLMLYIPLLLMFGVDMYRQNPESLRSLPWLMFFFLIGTIIAGVIIVVVLMAIGVMRVWSAHIKSEELKDANNGALSCASCSYRGSCSSPGSPCSQHQNWRQ